MRPIAIAMTIAAAVVLCILCASGAASGAGLEDSPGTAAAARALSRRSAGGQVRFFRSDFEVVDSSGRQLFSDLKEVPILLDGKQTQPDWVQDFGATADPARRDRFPREPMATFSSVSPRAGHRSLHLHSRGDHALVRLARPLPAAGGGTFRAEGWVRLQGLREASVQLRMVFRGEQLPAAERFIASEPARGDGGWKAIRLEGRIPDGAESADLQILLLGSYSDRETHAWIDSLELEVGPGIRLHWGNRRLLLFGEDEPEVPFNLDAGGLAPGGYRLEAALQPLSLDPAAPPRKPFAYSCGRFVSAENHGDSGDRSALAASLRFRGNLREMFAEGKLPRGLHDLQFRILGPLAGEDPRDALVAARSTERLGILPAARGPLSLRGVRMGWALNAEELRRGDLQVLDSLPKGFVLAELLWDISGETSLETPLDTPPEVRLRGDRRPLHWRGRLGPAFLENPDLLLHRLLGASRTLRAWAISADPADPQAAKAMERVRAGFDFIAMGARSGGDRPPWANFRVHEVDPSRRAAAGAARSAEPEKRPGKEAMESPAANAPVANDWTIVELFSSSDERGEALSFSRLLLELAAGGHRRIFWRGAPDLWRLRGPGKSHAPSRGVFAWATLGRALAGGEVRKRDGLDPRGEFYVVGDGPGDGAERVLVAFASGTAAFTFRAWTGAPVEGVDLYGDPVAARYDPETFESEIAVAPEPAIYRGIDLLLMDTVESLTPSAGALQSRKGKQSLEFQFTNRTSGPLEVRLAIRLPPSWRVESSPPARTVPPGETARLPFYVAIEESTGRDLVNAELTLDVEREGRRFTRRREMALAVESPLIKLSGETIDPATRRLRFAVANQAARPLSLRVFCRLPLGEGRELVESWDERLAPRAERRLELPLPADDGVLDGKVLHLGVEVSGHDDFISERFAIRRTEDRLVLVQQ